MGLMKKHRAEMPEEAKGDGGSLAIAYAMKKKAKKMADGGNVMKDLPPKKQEPLPEEHGDMVDRVLAKCMSKGGMVANEQSERADEMPNEFDDLALRDDLDFSYDAANSGDDLGSHLNQEEDMHDRILRKRAMR